jgi:hypothetical protein
VIPNGRGEEIGAHGSRMPNGPAEHPATTLLSPVEPPDGWELSAELVMGVRASSGHSSSR